MEKITVYGKTMEKNKNFFHGKNPYISTFSSSYGKMEKNIESPEKLKKTKMGKKRKFFSILP